MSVIGDRLRAFRSVLAYEGSTSWTHWLVVAALTAAAIAAVLGAFVAKDLLDVDTAVWLGSGQMLGLILTRIAYRIARYFDRPDR